GKYSNVSVPPALLDDAHHSELAVSLAWIGESRVVQADSGDCYCGDVWPKLLPDVCEIRGVVVLGIARLVMRIDMCDAGTSAGSEALHNLNLIRGYSRPTIVIVQLNGAPVRSSNCNQRGNTLNLIIDAMLLLLKRAGKNKLSVRLSITSSNQAVTISGRDP